MTTMPRTNATPDGDPNGALDVWLRFETSHEATATRTARSTYGYQDFTVIED